MATGRSGSVTPSTSTVAPTRACSRYSRVTSRMVAAGTSETFAAHSGVYGFTWSRRSWNEGRAVVDACSIICSSGPISMPATVNSPSSAYASTSGVSKATAAARFSSQTSGLRVAASRR